MSFHLVFAPDAHSHEVDGVPIIVTRSVTLRFPSKARRISGRLLRLWTLQKRRERTAGVGAMKFRGCSDTVSWEVRGGVRDLSNV